MPKQDVACPVHVSVCREITPFTLECLIAAEFLVDPATLATRLAGPRLVCEYDGAPRGLAGGVQQALSKPEVGPGAHVTGSRTGNAPGPAASFDHHPGRFEDR